MIKFRANRVKYVIQLTTNSLFNMFKLIINLSYKYCIIAYL